MLIPRIFCLISPPSSSLPSPYSPSLTTLLSLNLSRHIMPTHSSPADSFEAIRSGSADESERVRTDERWRQRALQENRQGSMKSQERSCHSTTCRTCRKVMIGIISAFSGVLTMRLEEMRSDEEKKSETRRRGGFSSFPFLSYTLFLISSFSFTPLGHSEGVFSAHRHLYLRLPARPSVQRRTEKNHQHRFQSHRWPIQSFSHDSCYLSFTYLVCLSSSWCFLSLMYIYHPRLTCLSSLLYSYYPVCMHCYM